MYRTHGSTSAHISLNLNAGEGSQHHHSNRSHSKTAWNTERGKVLEQWHQRLCYLRWCAPSPCCDTPCHACAQYFWTVKGAIEGVHIRYQSSNADVHVQGRALPLSRRSLRLWVVAIQPLRRHYTSPNMASMCELSAGSLLLFTEIVLSFGSSSLVLAALLLKKHGSGPMCAGASPGTRPQVASQRSHAGSCQGASQAHGASQHGRPGRLR